MTNKEALIAVVEGVEISQASMDKVLMDKSVSAEENYTPSNEQVIDECAIRLLRGHLLKSVKEGGYSVEWDRDAIEARIAELQTKWGLSNESEPTITSRRLW